MRTLRLSTLVAAVVLTVAQPAHAQTDSYLQQAAEALNQDAVFVHPDAATELSPGEADALRTDIGQADAGPIHIAVLPEEAALETGGDESRFLLELGAAVARQGTYAVVIGNELRAGSTDFDEGLVPSIADYAVEQNEDETYAVLSTFVDLVGRAARGEELPAEVEGQGDSGGIGLLPVLLLIGGGLWLFSAARRKRREQTVAREDLEEVRGTALDDLVALGNDLRELDLDVKMPDADPQAKQDYVRALESYEQASSALDRARRVEDLQPVAQTLDEGRYALACARARLAGEPIPERRSPCFFDPRHGPSVRDVEWAPPGGTPRAVPACARDAASVEAGEEPMSREVLVRGQATPYWNAPGYYSPWFGGYYGGFGLFEGMLLGSMLSGGWGGGWGYGWGGAGGDGGDGGSGDFGGGDFGGGDFGGGDFGGGDFGGGDFGG